MRRRARGDDGGSGKERVNGVRIRLELPVRDSRPPLMPFFVLSSV